MTLPIRYATRQLAVTALLLIGVHASTSQAEIEPAAKSLVQTLAAKLQAAQTVRLTAKHQIDPAIGVGNRLDKGPLAITVKRPNQVHVLQSGGEDTREMTFDGKTLCIMHPQLKHHALEPLKASSIEQFADQMDTRFGFRPPVAELLSEDLASQLLLHVTSAKVTGIEWIGFTRCDRLHFEQEGMTGDLWVGKKDGLPRRYLLTFTSIKNHPTWDVHFSKWDLNAPINDSLFAKRPAADSSQVKMIKSR